MNHIMNQSLGSIANAYADFAGCDLWGFYFYYAAIGGW